MEFLCENKMKKKENENILILNQIDKNKQTNQNKIKNVMDNIEMNK